MDVAGNNVGIDRSAGLMGNDEPQVGYRGEWIPSVENVLPCKALLLPYGSGSYIRSDDHRVQHEGAVLVSPDTEV